MNKNCYQTAASLLLNFNSLSSTQEIIDIVAKWLRYYMMLLVAGDTIPHNISYAKGIAFNPDVSIITRFNKLVSEYTIKDQNASIDDMLNIAAPISQGFDIPSLQCLVDYMQHVESMSTNTLFNKRAHILPVQTVPDLPKDMASYETVSIKFVEANMGQWFSTLVNAATAEIMHNPKTAKLDEEQLWQTMIKNSFDYNAKFTDPFLMVLQFLVRDAPEDVRKRIESYDWQLFLSVNAKAIVPKSKYEHSASDSTSGAPVHACEDIEERNWQRLKYGQSGSKSKAPLTTAGESVAPESHDFRDWYMQEGYEFGNSVNQTYVAIALALINWEVYHHYGELAKNFIIRPECAKLVATWVKYYMDRIFFGNQDIDGIEYSNGNLVKTMIKEPSCRQDILDGKVLPSLKFVIRYAISHYESENKSCVFAKPPKVEQCEYDVFAKRTRNTYMLKHIIEEYNVNNADIWQQYVVAMTTHAKDAVAGLQAIKLVLSCVPYLMRSSEVFIEYGDDIGEATFTRSETNNCTLYFSVDNEQNVSVYLWKSIQNEKVLSW